MSSAARLSLISNAGTTCSEPRSAGLAAISASRALQRRAVRCRAHCRASKSVRSLACTIAKVSCRSADLFGRQRGLLASGERELGARDGALSAQALNACTSRSNRSGEGDSPSRCSRAESMYLSLVLHLARRGIAGAHALGIAHADAAGEGLERRAAQLVRVASVEELRRARTTPAPAAECLDPRRSPSRASIAERARVGGTLRPDALDRDIERHHLLADRRRCRPGARAPVPRHRPATPAGSRADGAAAASRSTQLSRASRACFTSGSTSEIRQRRVARLAEGLVEADLDRQEPAQLQARIALGLPRRRALERQA